MAKKKAAGKKKLVPYKEVTVKNHNGEHKRAVRSGKTPVAINEMVQENVKKTAVINSAAKRVHDLLRHCLYFDL